MAKLSVILSTNENWWGIIGCKAIQFAECNDVSHASMMLQNCEDMVYESTFPLSREMPFRRWMKIYNSVRIYSFEVPAGLAPFIRKDLLDLMDRTYSLCQLFWIGVGIIARILKRKYNAKVLNGDSRLICTELCAIVLKKYMGVDFGESLDGIGLFELEQKLIALKAKEAAGGNVWIS